MRTLALSLLLALRIPRYSRKRPPAPSLRRPSLRPQAARHGITAAIDDGQRLVRRQRWLRLRRTMGGAVIDPFENEPAARPSSGEIRWFQTAQQFVVNTPTTSTTSRGCRLRQGGRGYLAHATHS